MPDYGHDLQFGFFLDPTTGNSARTVEIAHILDDLGYDLIGIQVFSARTFHNDGIISRQCAEFRPLLSMQIHNCLSAKG